MPRRAFNVVAASMPLLALASPLAVTEGSLRYHVPYVCNGERIVVTRCRSDSDQPRFPPTQPGSDYCAVVYPDRPLRNGITVETAELRANVLSKLGSCNGAHPSVTNEVQPAATKPPDAQTPPNAPAPVAADDTRARDLLAQGDKYRKAGDVAKAVGAYNQVLALTPARSDQAADAHYGLGTMALDQKDYRRAIPDLLIAQRLKPTEPEIQVELGDALMMVDSVPQAIPHFQEAIRLQPDFVYAYQLLSMAYWLSDDKANALRVCETLKPLDAQASADCYDEIKAKPPAK
jgi:tetratricopeptide (TPR) repeat protein